MLITSTDNSKIKNIKKILNGKNNDYFIIEGDNLIEEALKNNLLVEVYALENYSNPFDLDVIYVTQKVMKNISDLKSLPKVIGISKFKDTSLIGDKIVLLDDVQDPGNAGTIIRNACAFGIDTIVFSKKSVNPYNAKVLRSSSGMIYNINIIVDDLKNIINKIKEKNIKVIGTSLKSSADIRELKLEKYAVIFGNEGNGINKEILDLCDATVKINMKSICESLNVAASSAIILYELYEGEE